MDDYDWSAGMASLARRALIARLTIILYLALVVVSLAMQGYFIETGSADPEMIALAETIDKLTLAGFLGSVVAISFWIYRAHANLRLYDAGPFEFSPQSAVGWFFVPFANLVMPFRAMGELWRASGGDRADGAPGWYVGAWWGCFLGGGLLANVGSVMLNAAQTAGQPSMTGLVVFDIGFVARGLSAVLLHEIIRSVGPMQREHADVAQVFA